MAAMALSSRNVAETWHEHDSFFSNFEDSDREVGDNLENFRL